MTLSIFLWLFVAFVATLQFERLLQFSSAERRRLVKCGDKAALAEEAFLLKQPALYGLKYILETLGIVAFSVSCLLVFEPIRGTVVIIVGLLLVRLLQRIPLVCRAVDGLYRLIEPAFSWAVECMTTFFLLFRGRTQAQPENISLNSREELLSLVKRSPGVLTSDERQRLEANLAFGEKRVGDVMTARSMICGIEQQEVLGPLVLDELYKTKHSRFPVYDGDIDHIVGMLYLYDLVDMNAMSKTVREAMHPKVCYVREDHDLSRALKGLLKTRQHLFVVINKQRETVGLLSLEDVLEALLGQNIRDDFEVHDDIHVVAQHGSGKLEHS